jgi:putative tryptophan/tyrosine transport system substrate-binding protein
VGQWSRRQFLRGGVTLATLVPVVGCQSASLPWQPAKVPRIGFLATGPRAGRWFLAEAFVEGLREHGYEDGRNVALEYRFSEDRDDRLPALAAELLALPVDLILASGVPASVAAREATRTVPIVMGSLAADAIGEDFIESYSRPGRNITGMTSISAHLTGKRLELFTDIIPGLTRVAAIDNPTNPSYRTVLQELEAAAREKGVELLRVEARAPQDLPLAFAAAIQQQAGALIAPADPLTTNRPNVVADLQLHARLPTLMERREFAVAGGLLAFGANLADLYRRSAAHVDKILKGADPAVLPMEQPTKFDLAINLKAAQALGLTIPPAVLQQATEIIQ